MLMTALQALPGTPRWATDTAIAAIRSRKGITVGISLSVKPVMIIMAEADISRREYSIRLQSFFIRSGSPTCGSSSSSSASSASPDGIITGPLKVSASFIITDGPMPVSGNHPRPTGSNISCSANLSAPVGQAVTHAGSMPSAVLS